MGQHFLLDANLTGRIARAAGDISGCSVIEVGPGPGGLTRALLEAGAARVIAIEKDRRCLAALEELREAYPSRLSLLDGDALKIDPCQLGAPPRCIVANLPYNIATKLLTLWLTALVQDPSAISGLVLMFQKEVAQRLSARPRSKDYGRLSVFTQWLAEVHSLFDVPARAFVPPPKVTSSVVSISPYEKPLHPARLADLERVTAAAFGQRRKMLRRSLKSLTPDVGSLLAEAGIAETARAEELEVAQFCSLARLLARPAG